MANTQYWLTFRIADATVANKASGTRRDDLYDAIDRISPGWWVEPTSFVMFDSEKTIGEVAIVCKGAIALAHDLVLIREVNSKNARVIGKVDYLDTLKAYMPYVIKV